MSYRDRISRLENDMNDRSHTLEKIKQYSPYAMIMLLTFLILITMTPSFLKERRIGTKVKKINVVKFISTYAAVTILFEWLYYKYGSTLLSEYLK